MKLKIAAALLAAGSASALAQSEAITSNVIHDHTYVGAGYGYLNDISGSDVNAHGVIGAASFDINNFLVGADGGYYWTDEGSTEIWNVAGTVGYVFRPMQNRLNIVPAVSLGYTEVEDFDVTTVAPAIGVSYALNNAISVNAGYAYTFDIDEVDDAQHSWSVGAAYALSEQVGLAVNGIFVEEQGFSGLTALVRYHF